MVEARAQRRRAAGRDAEQGVHAESRASKHIVEEDLWAAERADGFNRTFVDESGRHYRLACI